MISEVYVFRRSVVAGLKQSPVQYKENHCLNINQKRKRMRGRRKRRDMKRKHHQVE